MTRQIKLCLCVGGSGDHLASWRHPSTRADGKHDIGHYVDIVRNAERGLFDGYFLADGLAAERNRPNTLGLEPTTLLSALAAVTTHIGLIGTISTSYDEPYNVARRLASLDWLSKGRAGWNVVTSANPQSARNFGLPDQLDPEVRYRRAGEFVDVVTKLWDSWEDDIFIWDKAAGVFAHTDRGYEPRHKGEFFSVEGAMNVARPPQGWPVIVQAGQSASGRDLASRIGEIIFTAQLSFETAKSYSDSVKQGAIQYGRDPRNIIVMPGVAAYVGVSEADAREQEQSLADLIVPETGVALLSHYMGFDLSRYDVDGPVPDMPVSKGYASRQISFLELAREQKLSIRQLYQKVACARGHWIIAGNPVEIADQLQYWFENGAADGFNLMPPLYPASLDDFIDKVVPELQNRGLYRTAYEGETLRENLGLPRPENQYVEARRKARSTAIAAAT